MVMVHSLGRRGGSNGPILYQVFLIFPDSRHALALTLDGPAAHAHYFAMNSVHVFRHRVRADEIDELQHAGNVHYVRWLQHAAVAHSKALGWSGSKYREMGSGWVVRSHRITYLKPAFEGDELEIHTWVANMRPATSLRRYEIFNAGGERLAVAETDWAFINYESQRPVRIPRQVRSSFPIKGDRS